LAETSINLALQNLVGIMEGLRKMVTKVEGMTKFRSTLEHLVGVDRIKNGLKRLENAKSHLSWAIQFQKEIPQNENDSILDGEADKFWNAYFHTEVEDRSYSSFCSPVLFSLADHLTPFDRWWSTLTSWRVWSMPLGE
jgi:hypothetical protein